MNIKILIVRFFDWVILAALALLALYGLYSAFLVKDKTVDELGSRIQRAVRTIEREVDSEDVPAVDVQDQYTSLRNRYERLPVISAYVVNPFKPTTVVPGEDLLLGKDQIKTIRYKSIRIVEAMAYNKANLDIAFDYDPNKDESVVKITAKAKSNTTFKLRDEQDTLYVRRVIVADVAKLPPPQPPFGVVIEAYVAQEEAGGKRKPAKVLIAFMPDNPETVTPELGITTHAEIWRKPAGAPDMEYALLNDKPLPQLSQEAAQALRQEFLQTDAGERGAGAMDGADLRMPTNRSRPAAPMGVEEAEAFVTRDSRRGTGRDTGAISANPSTVLLAKNFAYVDRAVDDGESYVYKIVTLSQGEGLEAKRAEVPYVTPTPVEVPSLVSFIANTVSASGATFVVTRPRPDTGQDISERFRTERGMSIGNMVQLKERNEGLDRMPGPRYKFTDVDFSTNCVFIGGITRIKSFTYKLGWDKRARTFTYDLKQSTEPPRLVSDCARVLALEVSRPRGLWRGPRGTGRYPVASWTRPYAGRHASGWTSLIID